MAAAHSSVAVREATLLLPTLQAQKTLALFTAPTLISPEQVCVSASVRVSMDLSDLLFSSFRWRLCVRVCVRICDECVFVPLLLICMALTVYV